jgi:hypothetical protein
MSAIIPTQAYKCYFNQGSVPCQGPTSANQGGITSAMAAGSWLSSCSYLFLHPAVVLTYLVVAGYLTDILGRKKAIQIGAVIW